MNKMFKGIVALAMTTAVFAQSTGSINTTSTSSANSLSGVLEKLKASPFSLGILNETLVAAEGANGYSNNFYFYPGYKINDTFTVKAVPVLSASYSGKNKSQSDMNYDYNYMSARLYISKILNEKDHGINLSMQVRDYIYKGSDRGVNGYDQKLRIYPYASMNLGKFNLSAAAFVEFYDKNDKTRATVQRNDLLSLGATYSINDSWSSNITLEYYHDHDTMGTQDKEYLTLTLPNIGYSYKDLSVNLYLSTDIMVNKDDSIFKDDPLADATIVAEMFYSAF